MTTNIHTGPAPHTPEWYDEHRRILTATDMAAVLGFSEYKQALDVYLDKKGVVAPFAGNEHTRRGQRYEPVILADYAETMGISQMDTPMPLVYHPSLDCLGATPDAEAEDSTGEHYGVEAKFTMSPKRAEQLGEDLSDWIPEDWMVQVQTQMACTGWKRVDLACLLYGRLRVFCCQRSEDLIGQIEAAAREMWERIANEDPPEPNWQHAGTPALMKAMHPGGSGIAVDLTPDAAAIWASRAASAKAETEAKAMKEGYDAQFRHAMGDADIGLLPSGRRVKRIFCKATSVAYEREAYNYFKETK